MRFYELKSAEDITRLVKEIGFLPFFANEIEGFSIEEHCPRELWFSDDADGPWEWKGPAARTKKCVYGKFFRNKAGFVSLEMFPEFANFRRAGYDFDARYDDGLAAKKDKDVYDAIIKSGAVISKTLKAELGYRKDGNKGFDSIITRLQMQTYVNISDFVYMRDKRGQTYGWGVAEYSTPEEMFGCKTVTAAYRKDPSESKEYVIRHLGKILPDIPKEQLLRFIR